MSGRQPCTRLIDRIKLRNRADAWRRRVLRLTTPRSRVGRVLMSVNLRGFLDPALLKGHGSRGRHVRMAHDWLELGYDVDVIDWKNDRFLPRAGYDIFVDVGTNMERLSPLLGPDCTKVFHGMWPHFTFHNAAVYRRHLDLQERRGISIVPDRVYEINRAIEISDFGLIMGNEFTCATYRFAGRPLVELSQYPQATYPFVEKDFGRCRKRFLWIGGRGLVYKGLDLVLEAFASMPDYQLVVCGPIHKEPAFANAFRRELYETPNIRTVGWVDVTSNEFLELTRTCLGVVYPSASEACAASPCNAMHAGLIPILSRETGLDVPPGTGYLLAENTIEEIRQTVEDLSQLPARELHARARATYDHMQQNHSREAFVRQHRKAITRIAGKSRQRVTERERATPAPWARA